MSYIKTAVSGGEKILLITRVHWIYLVQGLFWSMLPIILAVGLEVLYFAYKNPGAPVLQMDLWRANFEALPAPGPMMLAIFGLIVFLPFLAIYVSHEVGLTDQRIIHKKGLISVQIMEVDLSDIRGEIIVHGWLGWLLGYGRIRLDCRFIHDMYLPAISRPHQLVKLSHQARRKPVAKEETEQVIDPPETQKIKTEPREPAVPPEHVQPPAAQTIPPAAPVTAMEPPMTSAINVQELEQTRRRANVKMKLRIMKDVIKGSFRKAT